MTEKTVCDCFKPGGKMCSPCFMIWYDSGITSAEHLFAERQERERQNAWPFGHADLDLSQLKKIDARFKSATT